MRAFFAVAFEPPLEGPAALLSRALRPVAGRDWRFAPPGTVHLTLRFLGEISDETASAARRAAASVAARTEPFAVAPGPAGAFPAPSRARVLWMGLVDHDGRLARLREDLDAALATLPLARDDRPFTPHVTVARRRMPGRGDAARLLAAAPPPAGGFHRAVAILFVASVLAPEGARHAVLARFPLGPAR